MLSELPAVVDPRRVALVGLHSWTDDDFPNVQEWGLRAFAPEDLRRSSSALLQWIGQTGCSKVAIHFDVDTVDSDEIVLGLGPEPGGLSSEQVRRVVHDVSTAADVAGFTVAEFFPRQVMQLQQILRGFPLLGNRPVT